MAQLSQEVRDRLREEEKERVAAIDAATARMLAARKPITEGLPKGYYAATWPEEAEKGFQAYESRWAGVGLSTFAPKYCPACNLPGSAFATGIALCKNRHSWTKCPWCKMIYGPVDRKKEESCPLCHDAKAWKNNPDDPMYK